MHASATQVCVPNYFTELFLSELIAYQNTMESDGAQYKSSKNYYFYHRNSSQNVKCKYLEQNYCSTLDEIWLLSDDLRRLSIDSPYHHIRAWNSIIPVFFPICSLSMIRGLFCLPNCVKRQSCSGPISKNR